MSADRMGAESAGMAGVTAGGASAAGMGAWNRLRDTVLPALGRLLMAYIFVTGGWGKLNAPAGTIHYIAAGGLPLPQLGYAVAVAVELGGGLAVLLGWRTAAAGLLLAAWCLITGAMFHYVPSDHNMMLHLMKNVCMAGGFLQLAAFGAGRWSLDAVRLRRQPGTLRTV